MARYRTQFETVNQAQRIDASGCNAITFVNKGTATAQVESFPLSAGESLSIEGNPGDKDFSLYNIVFPGAGTQLVYVIRKIDLE